MKSLVDRVMDVLANLGFVMRDTRREKVAEDARRYGAETDGFQLSIYPVDPAPTISVAIKNVEAAERRAALPGWLSYYQVNLVAPGGGAARLTGFGQQVLDVERTGQKVNVVFPPGEPVATEIPIGTFYEMRALGIYLVRVSARSPVSSEILTSNELTITI